MNLIPSRRTAPRVRAGVILSATLLLGACTGANPPGAAAAAGPASSPAAAPSATAASAPAAPSLDNAAAPAVSPGLAKRLIGTWRQLCQTYIPNDGSSDITYSVDQNGPDRLVLEGIAKDYKSTSCSGPGTVIARPKFEQKIVGTGSVDGVEVIRLVDADAPDPAPSASKSVFGIDNGQLRIGSAAGARDADGFPSVFESPTDAYVNVTP